MSTPYTTPVAGSSGPCHSEFADSLDELILFNSPWEPAMCFNYLFRVSVCCVIITALASVGWAGPTDPVKGIKVSSVGNNLVAPSLNPPPVQQPDGTWALDSFFDFTYRADFVSPTGPVTLTGPGSGHLSGTAPTSADDSLLFNAEMLSLDLTGGPFFAIRESPTLQSVGQTQIAADPGGTFRINSFFDVFTELSVDGGQTWTPNDPAVWSFQSVPEPTTLVLATMALVGCAFRRRRSRCSATPIGAAFELSKSSLPPIQLPIT